MVDERFHHALRVVDGRAVGRPVTAVVALEQQRETVEVGADVAVRRRDDGRRPAHDVIAAEQRALLAQLIADVVRRVSRRVDAFDAPAVARDDVAVAHRDVGHEVVVGALLDLHAGLDAPRAVGAEAVARRAGGGLHRTAGGRVIAMGVGHQQMRDGLALERVEQRVDVLGEIGPGIDDGDIAPAQHVGAGAVPGEGARVARDDAPHAGCDLLEHAVRERELARERHRLAQGVPSVRVSPDTSLPASRASSSRSTRLSTLPEGLRGSASRTTSAPGTLKPARCSRQCACTAA